MDINKYLKHSFYPTDSPGVPPSANAHQLFKGFSFVAPFLLEDQLDGIEMIQSHAIEKSSPLSKVCTIQYDFAIVIAIVCIFIVLLIGRYTYLFFLNCCCYYFFI